MDDAEAGRLARVLWTLLEPYHAVTYFSRECLDAFVDAGLRGFWRGYFAGRAAPLGAVEAGPVVAMFFGFRADFVERAVPSVWSMATPAAALEARLLGTDRALRRLIDVDGSADQLAEVADLLRKATEPSSMAGRPIYAANAALDWPSEPHLAVWHAATLLREHRGDGHVAELTTVGLDGCEAHLLRVNVAGLPAESIQSFRGWDDHDWASAGERLRQRGWIDAVGGVTPAGSAVHGAVESATDRLASAPIHHLGRDRVDRVLRLLRPVVQSIAAEEIPYPNPMGVPPVGR